MIPPKEMVNFARRQSKKARKVVKNNCDEATATERISGSDPDRDKELDDIESQISSNINLGMKSMSPDMMTRSLDDSIRKNPGMRSIVFRLASTTETLRKPTHSQLKSSFIAEMRHLSKLR